MHLNTFHLCPPWADSIVSVALSLIRKSDIKNQYLKSEPVGVTHCHDPAPREGREESGLSSPMNIGVAIRLP